MNSALTAFCRVLWPVRIFTASRTPSPLRKAIVPGSWMPSSTGAWLAVILPRRSACHSGVCCLTPWVATRPGASCTMRAAGDVQHVAMKLQMNYAKALNGVMHACAVACNLLHCCNMHALDMRDACMQHDVKHMSAPTNIMHASACCLLVTPNKRGNLITYLERAIAEVGVESGGCCCRGGGRPRCQARCNETHLLQILYHMRS